MIAISYPGTDPPPPTGIIKTICCVGATLPPSPFPVAGPLVSRRYRRIP